MSPALGQSLPKLAKYANLMEVCWSRWAVLLIEMSRKNKKLDYKIFRAPPENITYQTTKINN